MKCLCVSKEFEGNIFPTNSDVMKYYLWCKLLLKDNANVKNSIVSNISQVILLKLKNIWQRAIIPDQRILSLIANLNEKYKAIKKNIKTSQMKVTAFRVLSEKTLFDISAYKCENFSNC